MEPRDPAGETPDGLADPEATKQFRQAVEHRLSEPAPEGPAGDEEAPEAELDEDNPVSTDNPE